MYSLGFRKACDGLFDADGERRVSVARPVWFRNGGCAAGIRTFPGRAPSIENVRRIKSIGYIANFRRFNLNANTCDLSTTVSQEPIDRSHWDQRDGRGRKMFFLLRMAFWLGLVLVLLPREKTPDSDKLPPQVGASEAV